MCRNSQPYLAVVPRTDSPWVISKYMLYNCRDELNKTSQVTHPLARDALRGGEKSHLPEVEAYLIKLVRELKTFKEFFHEKSILNPIKLKIL